MKFNKWTVALAALGVVTLSSAAKAEEKASPVMTALSSTTISGYVDTSAEWNPGTGNANLPPYRFNSANKADGFNLDVVQLRIDKPLDEADWAAGYRADLWFGPDANALGTSSTGLNASDFGIKQAYVALRAPIGTGLDFKMGVFDSVIGYESIEAGNDPNFTRSYGNSIEPTTHTGLLASYRFCDAFSASAGVANTVSSTINGRANSTGDYYTGGNQAESYKTYMGSIALTAPESMGFLAGSTLYAGVVNGFSNGQSANGDIYSNNGNRINYYVGATVATPLTGLRLGAAWDYLQVWEQKCETWTIAGYASYQATEKLSFHLRAEYLDDGTPALGSDTVDATDPNNITVVPPNSLGKVLALTTTVQYDLWKNVISRLELRWDHSLSDQNIFGGTVQGEPNRDNAWMLGANVIYKF
jgi:Putative beta-barrel porin-2, OmpL-like. bbp2